ncbi:MAG TPA: ABC transporter permease [Pyrinomonadaceae bacterium]|nr:ABC transporter permease [Pyrinomonadaceae bacterium]
MHDWKNEIRESLSQLALRPLREAEIVEELGQHLEDRYEDLLLQGYAEDEAVQKTLSEFRQNDMIRDLRGLERTYLEPVELGQEPRSSQTAGLGDDLRYAFRTLLSQFGVSLIVLVTMGLGIGVNTTLFSTLELLAYRPFDFANQDRLVSVFERQRDTGLTRGSVAPGNFADWREQNQTFEELVAIKSSYFDLANASQPERLSGNFVSTSFFTVLGTPAALGRTFTAEGNETSRNQVVVLSDGLWRTRFGADPQIVGRSVKLNEETYTVVGVMPKDFHYPVGEGQLWVPLVSDDLSRRDHNLQVFGLPRRGVSLSQANEDLNRIALSLQSEYPDTNRGREARVVPLVKDATRAVRIAVPFMFISVLLVLLVACANVANILLVRAAARQKDIATRLALGASRFRVMRQMFAHSLVLSAFGGLLGLLMAYFGIKAMRSMPQDFSMFIPGWSKIGIDQTALVFTLAVSVLTGILSGLIPAWFGTRVDLNQVLKDDGPSVLGKASRRTTRWLVISEVAFSVVLLVGAGVMFRSFQRLLHTDLGVDATNVSTMQISLSGERYAAAHARTNFADDLTGRISALHPITGAGLATTVPLGYVYNRREVAGIGSTVFADADERRRSVTFRTITPGYLEAIGTSLRQGRVFTEYDRDGTPRVGLVNEAFAKQFLAGKQVIGETFFLDNGQRYEIVGLIANVINDDLDERADAEIYVPYAQEPSRNIFLVTRSDYISDALVQAIRGQVSAVDPSVPVFKVKPLQQYVDERMFGKRVAVYALAVGALIALLLAAVGIYSVVAYSVTQRTHEIGLRLALGASSRDILKLIIGSGLRLVLIGGGIGLAGALVLTQLLSGLLFGVSARDPVTLAGIISILAAVALLACYLPARRAMKLDPLVALRYQ